MCDIKKRSRCFQELRKSLTTITNIYEKQLEEDNLSDGSKLIRTGILLGLDKARKAVDDGINAPKLSEEEDGAGKHDAVAKVFGEEEKDDKDDDEHKIHEEVLDNHNNGPREDGSEQSTENTAPYAGEGVDTTNGEKPMQDMDDTVNQWSETNGMIVPGLAPIDAMNGGGAPPPPGMNGNGGGFGQPQPPGLDPNIAQEMGAQMPPMPQLNNNQMMRQMQYTIKHEMRNYNNKVISPLIRHIKAQKEALDSQRKAIKQVAERNHQLSLELRETKASSGNMKLDLDSMKQNATASFRETTPQLSGYTSPAEVQSVTGVQPLPNFQRNKVAIARSEIEQMDKLLNSNSKSIYN